LCIESILGRDLNIFYCMMSVVTDLSLAERLHLSINYDFFDFQIIFSYLLAFMHMYTELFNL